MLASGLFLVFQVALVLSKNDRSSVYKKGQIYHVPRIQNTTVTGSIVQIPIKTKYPSTKVVDIEDINKLYANHGYSHLIKKVAKIKPKKRTGLIELKKQVETLRESIESLAVEFDRLNRIITSKQVEIGSLSKKVERFENDVAHDARDF